MSGESPGATGFHRYHRGVPRMVTRSGLSLLVALVCVLGAGVAPVLADTPPTDPAAATTTAPAPETIPDGVVLGPVTVGGMTADEAVAAVTEAYAAPVVLRVGDRTLTVDPARFGTGAAAAFLQDSRHHPAAVSV